MMAQFVFPVITSILILGTLGISYDVFADHDGSTGHCPGNQQSQTPAHWRHISIEGSRSDNPPDRNENGFICLLTGVPNHHLEIDDIL